MVVYEPCSIGTPGQTEDDRRWEGEEWDMSQVTDGEVKLWRTVDVDVEGSSRGAHEQEYHRI